MLRMKVLLTLLLLSGLLVSACQPVMLPESAVVATRSAAAVPRFEPAACHYPVLADANAECGYLVVPEDRTNPASPAIRIYVIKFLSATTTPSADPIVVLPGGPGASGPFYAFLWSVLPVGEVMRADRDVYILEPRGAMYAEPGLYCSEMESDWTAMTTMTMAEEMAWSAAAYRACHDRLVDAGVNLSAYSFWEIGNDVADLATALEIETLNLYGVSYGTTPAMLAMRQHPDLFRSVILDSVIPPDAIYIDGMLGYLQTAFDSIFAACAADPVCNEAYPEVDRVFADVLASLRAAPVTVKVAAEDGVTYMVTVDDVKFVHYAYENIFVGMDYAALPAGIFAAQNGDLSAPAALWLGYLADHHGPNTPEAGAWAKGMTYSAMCLADGSVTDLATTRAIYAATATLPSVQDYGQTFVLGEWLAPCEYWAVTAPTPNLAIEPVSSELPVLFLNGALDPETPAVMSEHALVQLPNHFAYVLPAAHGQIVNDCALEIIAQFLVDPMHSPDDACIATMTPAWVLPD